MLEQFLRHIRDNKLIHKGDEVLLAVSGGIDSMVLLHLFLQANIPIGVAHANFQLRGAESDTDEQFVREFCKELDIPFYSTRFDTSVHATSNKLSIQMAARELRYSWFRSLMVEKEYTKLATAHHLSDSMETSLMHWIHGTSLEGLLGIPLHHDQLIRPMLFATRDEIVNYAQQQHISWREDSSNQSIDYLRNQIRHQVIPELKKVNPSLEQTVYRGVRKLQGDAALMELGVQTWREKFVSTSGNKLIIQKKGFDAFEQGAASILHRLVKIHGFNFDVCEEVIRALPSQPGKRFLSNAHQLVVDRDEIIVTTHVISWEEVLINQHQEHAALGPWHVSMEHSDQVELTDNTMKASVDASLLSYPITWRRWKPGDYFFPLGMNHKKKISDFLIDAKIAISDKDTITVLESAGEIVWVAGYRIDNRFKITDQTKRVTTFSLSSHFV
jgi:tRNA(Ile)-lysidine synthase